MIKFIAEGLGYQTNTTFIKVYLSPWDYRHWNISRVLAIHIFPLFLLVLAGIYFLLNLRDKRTENSILRLVQFWLMLWFFSLTVSLLVISPFGTISPENNPMYQDFSVFAVWLKIPLGLMAALAAIGIAGLILLGFVSAYFFFSCSPFPKDLRNAEGRRFWLITGFYIPVILALPLSIACTYPEISIAHLVMSACAIFVGLGMNLYAELRLATKIRVSNDVTNRFSFDFLCLLILLIAVIRYFM